MLFILILWDEISKTSPVTTHMEGLAERITSALVRSLRLTYQTASAEEVASTELSCQASKVVGGDKFWLYSQHMSC